MTVAKLDYALLAEFAKLDAAGSMNIIGAGFVRIAASAIPAQQLFSVVGRLWCDPADSNIPMRVVFSDRAGQLRIASEGLLSPQPHAATVDGLVSVSFVSTQIVPVPRYGMYDVEVWLGDEMAQALFFEVVPVEP